MLRIQQLLQLNGFKIQADGIWHSGVTDALVRFQRKVRSPTELYFDDNAGTARKSIAPNFGVNSGPEPRWIDPNDGLLFELAYRAGVLIRLAAGGSIWRHGIAFEYVHRWCEEQHIPFSMDWARPHAVWGFAGYPTWAIATQISPGSAACLRH